MGLFKDSNAPRTTANGVWERFPYTNFHDMNLDWVLQLCRYTEETLQELPEAIETQVQDALEKFSEDQTAALKEAILGADQAVNVMSPPDDLTPFDNTGTQNNGEAWTAMIQWMKENGRQTVYFPAGTYLLPSQQLPDNFAIIGDGRYQTIIKADRFQVNPLFFGKMQGVYIADVTLDWNNAQQGRMSPLIEGDIDGGLISNVRFVGGSCAVHIGAASAAHVQLSELVCDGQADACISIENSPAQLTITGIVMAPQQTGILCKANNVSVTGGHCLVDASTTAINVSGNDCSFEWSGNSAYTDTGARNSFRSAGALDMTAVSNVGVTAVNVDVAGNDVNVDADNATVAVNETLTQSADKIVMTDREHTVTTTTEVHDASTRETTVTDSDSYTNTGDATVDIHGNTTVDLTGVAVTVENSASVSTGEGLVVGGKKLTVQTEDAVGYKKPTVLTENFNAVPMTDPDGNQYNVLVQGATWPPEMGGGGGGEAGTDPNAIHTTGGTMTGPLTMQGTDASINLQDGAKIMGVGTPTANGDVATKGYTDTAIQAAIADLPETGVTEDELTEKLTEQQTEILNEVKDSYLPLTGGTLTGNLTAPHVLINNASISEYQGAGLAFKNSAASTSGLLTGGASLAGFNADGILSRVSFYSDRLQLSSGTGNADIRINKVAAPTADNDAANKAYVDSAVGEAGGDVTYPSPVTCGISAAGDYATLNANNMAIVVGNLCIFNIGIAVTKAITSYTYNLVDITLPTGYRLPSGTYNGLWVVEGPSTMGTDYVNVNAAIVSSGSTPHILIRPGYSNTSQRIEYPCHYRISGVLPITPT